MLSAVNKAGRGATGPRAVGRGAAVPSANFLTQDQLAVQPKGLGGWHGTTLITAENAVRKSIYNHPSANTNYFLFQGF